MFAKTVVALCAQAILIQLAFSQYISVPSCGCNSLSYSNNLGVSNLCGCNSASGLSLGNLAGSLSASNGGGLTVSSGSPLSPNGLSLISDNVIEGGLLVNGQSPFISAVGLGGNLATSGSASVNYACGNGQIGLLSEGVNGLYGSGLVGNGLIGNGLVGNGLGLTNIGGLGCGLGYNNLGYNNLGYSCGCGC